MKFIVIKGDTILNKEQVNYANKFQYNKTNYYSSNGCMIYFPEGVLYNDIDFSFKVTPKLANSYSDLYHIHNIYTPIHKSFSISIKADSVPHSLRDKVFIARIDDNGDVVYEGGKWSGSYLMAKVRQFGSYTLIADTTGPEITPVNFKNNDDVSNLKELKIEIDDDISGIEKYTPSLNGKWLLMAYDGKNDLLTYSFDEHMKKGTNKFKLIVADEKGNSTTFEASLKYN